MSTANGSAQILDDLALAHALADLADAITLDRYQAQDLVITTKPDNTPVTDADRAVEIAIREALATHRQSDGLVGEEFGSDKGSSGRYWVIDPIDGTRSLVNGYQTYVCQVALIENAMPIMSVVYEPALNNFYHSIKGQGSYKNDQKLNSNLQKLPDSIIDNYPEPISSIKNLIKATSISKYLECGSIALKMCRIADMSADLFLKKTRVFDWDIAPAALIVQEMGGVVNTLSGKQILFEGNFKKDNLLVSANQSIHEYTLGKINELNGFNDR